MGIAGGAIVGAGFGGLQPTAPPMLELEALGPGAFRIPPAELLLLRWATGVIGLGPAPGAP